MSGRWRANFCNTSRYVAAAGSANAFWLDAVPFLTVKRDVYSKAAAADMSDWVIPFLL